MIGAQSGFAIAFQEFIFYAGPIIQLLYWLVLAAAAVYAVLLLRRFVDHATAATAPAEGSTRPASAPASAAPVNVDEFVE